MFKSILSSYEAISLAGLQAKSALMERKETKYLMHINQLEKVLWNLQEQYDILDIKNKRIFQYQNIYFDTADYFFYYQHLEQQNSRTKVRMRKYVDSHLDFVEFKQKIKNIIRKERISIGENDFGYISQETLGFLEDCFKQYYNGDITFKLQPTLQNTYRRITLCHKTQEERVTIDIQLSYHDPIEWEKNSFSLPHLAIIECKYGDNEPFFNNLMQSLQIPEIKLCSKYCLGAHYLWKISDHSSFVPTIKYIEALRESAVLQPSFFKDYQQRISEIKRAKNQYSIAGNEIAYAS